MKTHNRLSAVALLLLAGAFVAPHTASAEPAARKSSVNAQYREFRVAFDYFRADPATQIYSDFKRTAKRACKSYSIVPLSFRQQEAECTAGLMDKVVQKLGRADVAAVHQDKMIQIAVR